MISTRVIKCPTCGRVLIALRRGYRCERCEKHFIIVANMLFEEKRNNDEILLDIFGLRNALEKLKEQR